MRHVRIFGYAIESASEISTVVRRNKLRTALAALSVAWGMFMLTILLGAGRGLANGVEWEFRDKAINSIWIDGGLTSIPFKGRQPRRSIQFNNQDFEELRRQVPEVDALSGRYYMWGEFFVRYGRRSAAFKLQGVHPADRYVERTDVVRGRFLNERDLRERRKVAVIGEAVRESLFGDRDPLGETIEIRGLSYLVVGVFRDLGNPAELRKIFIPVTTAQLVYNAPDKLHALLFTLSVESVEDSARVSTAVRELLGRRHQVSPDDRRAIRVRNFLEQFKKSSAVFASLQSFVWIVGVGTLLTGVIGVTNIMLIAVSERTREIGLRKAIGATPLAIVSMILFESLLITALAGYVGLVLGVVMVEAAADLLTNVPFVREPRVEIALALKCVAILSGAGVLGGVLPALRAARVDPIVALR